MRVRASNLIAALAVCAVLSEASVASAVAIRTWTVNSAQSFVRLNIPDQSVDFTSLGLELTGTARLRNANNSSWSDTGTADGIGGKRANIAGTFQTNTNVATSQIEFLPGGTMNAVDSTNAFHPDPTTWSGTDYMPGSVAPADFAAKMFGTVLVLITGDAGYLAVRDVLFGLTSGVLTTSGAALTGSIAAGSTNFGMDSANVHFEGLTLLGSEFRSTSRPLESSLRQNASGGTIMAGPPPFGLNPTAGRTMILNINVPVTITLEDDGTTATSDDLVLTGSVSGQLVASTIVPEPSSIVLVGVGVTALALGAIRRRRRG